MKKKHFFYEESKDRWKISFFFEQKLEGKNFTRKKNFVKEKAMFFILV